MGCCYKILDCFKKKGITQTIKSKKWKKRIKPKKRKRRTQNFNHPEIIYINRNNQVARNEDIQLEHQFIHVQKTTEAFKILSSFPLSSLIHSDKHQNGKIELNYYCPICLEYFNSILVTSCCSNYICRICAESYVSTIIKYMMNIKCLLCNAEENIILSDVDPSRQVNNIYLH